MKYLPLIAALAAFPAYAVNDNIASNNVNHGSLVGIGGSVNGSIINNGTGAGSTLSGGSATATGGNATATGGAGGSVTGSGNSTNLNTAVGGTSVGGNQTATTGSQSVHVENKRNPVGSAWSAPLVAADDTCMGSTSAGAQGIGFGLSVGSTWQDGDCVRRKDARELHNMGFRPAAIALMCQNTHVRKAMSDAGTPCVGVAEELETSRSYPTHGWDDSAKH